MIEYIIITIIIVSVLVVGGRKLKAQEDTIAKLLEQVKTLTAERDVQKVQADNYKAQLEETKAEFDKRIRDLKDAHDKQLLQAKDATEKQIEALKQMNKEQIESQLNLIKEQMQTTSEEVLKRRQEELGSATRSRCLKS